MVRMTPPSPWPSPHSPPHLGHADVHVWCAELDLPRTTLDRYTHLLAPDEQERADRFKFERDRIRYIAGRGWLRILLGRYLDRDPRELRFSYSAYRKPALVDASDPSSRRELKFNLSHCEGIAVYGIALDEEVGIDVERVRPVHDSAAIADRFFSPLERKALRRLPVSAWDEGFFRCWTRKEAYIKACGEGLSLPLTSFDVTVSGPAALLRSHAGDPAAWSLVHLLPADGFVGVVALRRKQAHITCLRADLEALEPSFN